MDGPLDGAQPGAAELGEACPDPPGHGIAQWRGDHDAAAPCLLRCPLLGPARDAFARIAEMQAEAKDDSAVRGLAAIGVGHGLLELDGRTKRLGGTREFGPRTVVRQLDQAAAVTRHGGLEAFDAVLRQPRRPASCVLPRQAGIIDHVCVENRRHAARRSDHGACPLESEPAFCVVPATTRVGFRTVEALFEAARQDIAQGESRRVPRVAMGG